MFKEKARCCRALQSRATIKEDVGSKLVHVVKKSRRRAFENRVPKAQRSKSLFLDRKTFTPSLILKEYESDNRELDSEKYSYRCESSL